MCRITDGRYLCYRWVLVPAGIKGADSDIPQTAAVDQPRAAATQAASVYLY